MDCRDEVDVSCSVALVVVVVVVVGTGCLGVVGVVEALGAAVSFLPGGATEAAGKEKSVNGSLQ